MSCYECKNYSELKEPRTQNGKDNTEYTIYGYCFKKIFKSVFNTGYPVYLPDGSCKKFVRKANKKEKRIETDGQMSITGLLG